MPAAADHYAKEAARLLSDDTFAEALNNVRLKALVELGEVDPTNITEIMRLQAIARCLPDVLDELKAMILASGKNDGGFDPNGQPA